MSINAGTAMGYLDLDIKGFEKGIKSATQQLGIFNKDTATSSQKMEALGGVMKSAGANLTKFVSVPLLGVGALSIKTAGDFQAGMSKVSALSGATGSDLKMLEDKAKEMGASTKFSATEASDALSYMALAGWDAEQMAAGLEPSLKLAGAAGMDLALTTDIVTDTMSMFGMKASEATKMTDMLAYAQANSNTDVQQLGEALKYCGASANAMGYDLADTTALLGTFADQGLKGSSAGTTLNAMFRDMKKNAEYGAIAIGKTKVAIVDSQGNYRDMTDILADVDKATQGMTTAQRDQALSSIWGTEALKGVNMAFEAGIPKIREFEEGIRNSDGTASKMYETMQDNLKGAIDNLKSAFEGACIVVGERLIPMFEGVVEWLTDCLTWFNNLDEGTQTFIVAIGALVAAIGPFLMIGGTLLSMLPNMVTGFNLAKDAVLAFQGATLAVPIAIALVVAAVVGLITAIGDNANALSFLQDKFGVFGTILGAICEFIAGVVQLTFGNMIIILTTAAEAIGAILTGKFSKVDDIVKEGWAKVENNTAKAMSNIVAETSTALELIKASTEQDLQGVVNTFDLAMQELPNLTRDNSSQVAKIFTDNMQNLDEQSLTILRGTSDSMAVLFEGITTNMDNEQAAKKFTANLESMATSGKFSTDTLQQDIDKAMKLINENMLIEGEAFKQTATNVFNQFKTIGQQGASEMADNVVAGLQGMDQETFAQLTSMGTTWSGIFSGISLDGSMNTQQMKDAILNNLNSMGIDGATLINQLRTESTTHMNSMSNEADKATKDMSSKIDANTKSAKDKASKNTKDLATDVDKNTKDAKDKANINTKGIATDTDTNTKKAASSASKNTAEGAKSVEQNMSKMSKDTKNNTSKIATDTDADFKKANRSIQQESTNMYNGAKQSFILLAQVAKQAGSDMYNGIRMSAEMMANSAKQSATSMYLGVTNSVTSMANSAISSWNNIRSAYSVPVRGEIIITTTHRTVYETVGSPSGKSKSIQINTDNNIETISLFNRDTYERARISSNNLNKAFYSQSVASSLVEKTLNKELKEVFEEVKKGINKKDKAEKRITINNTYNSPKPLSIRELKRQDEIQMRRLAMQLGF
jgi:TP901 family phage tail tape measure protein